MSKTKQFFIALPLLIALVLSSFMFSACGKKQEFTINGTLGTDANTVVNGLIEKVYNATVIKDDKDADENPIYNYTLAEIQELIPGVEFYVKAGTFKNIDKINKISLGGYTFTAGDDTQLSIGNNNFIIDDAFKVDGDKLYIAANIVAFEAVSSDKIKLNDKEFDFRVADRASALNITNVAFRDTTNTVTHVADKTNAYSMNITNGTNSLLIKYEDISADDIILTRKVLNGELQGYGLTGLDTVNSESVFMFYPMGWANTNEKYDTMYETRNGKTMVYDFYVVDNGVAKVELNYNITPREAE